jgi:hypothetical protein
LLLAYLALFSAQVLRKDRFSSSPLFSPVIAFAVVAENQDFATYPDSPANRNNAAVYVTGLPTILMLLPTTYLFFSFTFHIQRAYN